MKYLIDATLTITLEQVEIILDEPAGEELEFRDALLKKCLDRLVYLDIKGGRSGDGGFVSMIDCESIDSWESHD